jgi:hypothetical protein
MRINSSIRQVSAEVVTGLGRLLLGMLVGQRRNILILLGMIACRRTISEAELQIDAPGVAIRMIGTSDQTSSSRRRR